MDAGASNIPPVKLEYGNMNAVHSSASSGNLDGPAVKLEPGPKDHAADIDISTDAVPEANVAASTSNKRPAMAAVTAGDPAHVVKAEPTSTTSVEPMVKKKRARFK